MGNGLSIRNATVYLWCTNKGSVDLFLKQLCDEVIVIEYQHLGPGYATTSKNSMQDNPQEYSISYLRMSATTIHDL